MSAHIACMWPAGDTELAGHQAPGSSNKLCADALASARSCAAEFSTACSCEDTSGGGAWRSLQVAAAPGPVSMLLQPGDNYLVNIRAQLAPEPEAANGSNKCPNQQCCVSISCCLPWAGNNTNKLERHGWHATYLPWLFAACHLTLLTSAHLQLLAVADSSCAAPAKLFQSAASHSSLRSPSSTKNDS
jgi:hypothetical protein